MKQNKDFIIPSIDLLDGNIVRLKQGNYNDKTIYNANIDELIEKYKGFSNLHIVDLNGAKGEKNGKNEEIIKEIRKKFSGKIQIGGGIRTYQDAEKWLNLGVDKVVIGTLCIKNIKETNKIIKDFGEEKIVLAIDCEKINGVYIPKINGWRDCAKYILITDINVDGMMCGGNIELYSEIKRKFPNFQIQASGGISNFDDIKKLQEITDFAIVGRALYETNLLEKINNNTWQNEDFISKIDWKKVNNLIPVVVQDCKTFDVLMLGYCDKEAIGLTQKSGKMHFFSRTKQRIWMKGEESGNVLNVVDLRLDCDNDTMLAIVNPVGNTCHKGAKTCFNKRVNFLAELEEIIDNRIQKNDVEASYVARLFNKGINKVAQKVGEEATEVVIASLNESDDRFLNESADLLFHFLLLLKKKNFELSDVVDILKERRK